MQRSRSVWPAYRTISQPSRQFPPLLVISCKGTTFKRSYARRLERRRVIDPSKAATLPIFEVPLAVLDLDAENNPDVRLYTARDHEEQVRLWNRNTEFDALVGRMDEFRHGLRHKEMLWFSKLNPFDARRITERDVFQVALLGPPKQNVASQEAGGIGREATDTTKMSQSKTSDELLTRDILHSIGLSDAIIDDDRQLILVLLHRLQVRLEHGSLDDEKINEAIRVNLGRKAKFRGATEHKAFSTLRRVVAPFLKTREEMRTVREVQLELESACKEKETAGSIAFFNNLAINFISRGMWTAALEPRTTAAMNRLKTVRLPLAWTATRPPDVDKEWLWGDSVLRKRHRP